MRIEITARGIGLTTEFSGRVRRKLLFCLGRFAGQIRKVRLSLEDVNGPRGGVDKCCTIRVHIFGAEQVLIRQRHMTAEAAAAVAAERAQRAISRLLRLRRIAATSPPPKAAETDPREIVLVATRRRSTQAAVGRMLGDSGVRVVTAVDVSGCLEAMRTRGVAVLVCDADLAGGGWKALLHSVGQMPAPPLLIVTSPDADDKLWAEVLNLGGYDVLAQPLNPGEVRRTVDHAQIAFRAARRVSQRRAF